MKHTIYTKNEQDKYPLAPSDRALVKRAITAALAYEGFTEAAEVSVSFVDDDAIHALNRAFRGKDSATDVLSFPMVEDDEAFDCDEALKVIAQRKKCFDRCAFAQRIGIVFAAKQHKFRITKKLRCAHVIAGIPLHPAAIYGNFPDFPNKNRQHPVIVSDVGDADHKSLPLFDHGLSLIPGGSRNSQSALRCLSSFPSP